MSSDKNFAPNGRSSSGEDERPLPGEVHGAALAVGAASLDNTVETGNFQEAGVERGIPTLDEIPLVQLNVEPFKRAMHLYTYDEEGTVEAKERQVLGVDSTIRNAEQKQLLQDIATLREMAPFSYMYKELYTPYELHALVTNLTTLRQKRRGDFAELEDQVIDFVLGDKELADSYDPGIFGLVKGFEKRNSGMPMTWPTLARAASVSVLQLHDHMSQYEGGANYAVRIETEDKTTAKTSLKPIYQFAASLYAQSVLTTRLDALRDARRAAFVDNCTRINEWYATAKPAIDRLPANITGDRHAASWELSSLMSNMNIRLTSNEKAGIHKNYTVDPNGAFKLQLKIRFLITSIREQLENYIDPEEQEITPLDP